MSCHERDGCVRDGPVRGGLSRCYHFILAVDFKLIPITLVFSDILVLVCCW